MRTEWTPEQISPTAPAWRADYQPLSVEIGDAANLRRLADGTYIDVSEPLELERGARVDLAGALGVRGTITDHGLELGSWEVRWDNGHENAHAGEELVRIWR